MLLFKAEDEDEKSCQARFFAIVLRVRPIHEGPAKLSIWHDSSSSSHVLYMWLFSRVASRETMVSQSQNPLIQLL